jgi:hypothetical protein
MKFFLLIIFFTGFSLAASAQSANTNAKTRAPQTDEERAEQLNQEMNLPPEMRSRLAIERADNEHRKIVEDAEKMNTLSVDIVKHYSERNRLSSDDLKSVSAIEKLAKRILTFAGGSEEKIEADKLPSLGEAIGQLNKASESVKKILLTESRHVVSAKLIADANEAVNLAQLIRRLQK